VEELLEAKTITPSKIPCVAYVILETKNGFYCLCIGYKALNSHHKNNFPTSHIDDLMDELHEAYFFSKIDLCYSH
jgi:hypothetical protein